MNLPVPDTLIGGEKKLLPRRSPPLLRYATQLWSDALYAINERGLDRAPIRGEDPAIDILATTPDAPDMLKAAEGLVQSNWQGPDGFFEPWRPRRLLESGPRPSTQSSPKPYGGEHLWTASIVHAMNYRNGTQLGPGLRAPCRCNVLECEYARLLSLPDSHRCLSSDYYPPTG